MLSFTDYKIYARDRKCRKCRKVEEKQFTQSQYQQIIAFDQLGTFSPVPLYMWMVLEVLALIVITTKLLMHILDALSHLNFTTNL